MDKNLQEKESAQEELVQKQIKKNQRINLLTLILSLISMALAITGLISNS